MSAHELGSILVMAGGILLILVGVGFIWVIYWSRRGGG